MTANSAISAARSCAKCEVSEEPRRALLKYEIMGSAHLADAVGEHA